MRKVKKIIACILALSLLGASSVIASADTRPAFFVVEGTVVDIWESGYVQLEGEDGEISVFTFNENTYFISGRQEEIKVGDKVKGYVNSNAPMLMIYPPQYNLSAIAVNYEDLSEIKVDRFDENFLSWDGNLKLNLSEETEIIYQDGEVFEGELSELKDRALVVLYTITTRSLPPQTPPNKVIILFETAIPPILGPIEGIDLETPTLELQEEGNENDVIIFLNPTMTEIVVEGIVINAPTPYYNADNVPMVPLRAIGEALGYTLSWDSSTNSALLNGGEITVTMDKNVCVVDGKGSVELASAPENVDGCVYVPLTFFKDAAGLNNTYIFEGQVIIDNFEVFG